jgi:hypothetical protein
MGPRESLPMAKHALLRLSLPTHNLALGVGDFCPSITKHACNRAWESTPLKAIKCSTSIVGEKPHYELTNEHCMTSRRGSSRLHVSIPQRKPCRKIWPKTHHWPPSSTRQHSSPLGPDGRQLALPKGRGIHVERPLLGLAHSRSTMPPSPCVL